MMDLFKRKKKVGFDSTWEEHLKQEKKWGDEWAKKIADKKANLAKLIESVDALYGQKKARLAVLQGDSSLIQIPGEILFVDGAVISAIKVYFDEESDKATLLMLVDGTNVHKEYDTAEEAYAAFEHVLNEMPHGRRMQERMTNKQLRADGLEQ